MMRPLIAVLLALLAALPAQAADGAWAGTWDTRWRDGGALMELVQQGNKVTGTYPAYGGRIEAEMRGRELQGRWIEGSRSGGITFVLAADGQSFMGRFDTGEWWTGGRVPPGAHVATVDQVTPRQALRTFIMAGNAARTGSPDEFAKAAAVMEFGPAGADLAPGARLTAARALFELVDQTTFQLWSIPSRGKQDDRIELELKQAGTGVVLPLNLVRGMDKLWRVEMPENLGRLREALLARSGGRLPPPDDIRRQATARDAMSSFAAGFSNWNGSGRAQVLNTLDLSSFSDATRAYEGELAAAYLNEAVDRIGKIVPQEIPDDPASRMPYVVFSHPAGSIILSPGVETVGSEPIWRFTADTVRTARDVYTSIEDMPEVESGALPNVPSAYMSIRGLVRTVAPSLFARFGSLEAWQAVGVLVLAAGSFAVAFVVSWLLMAVMRRVMGGRHAVAERGIRVPLLLTLAFLLYRAGSPVLGLPEEAKRISFGVSGLALAVVVMWGGWRALDTLAGVTIRRAQRTAGPLDEIVVSLVLGALKLALMVSGLLYIAQVLSIPYEGVLAGLGIGGLAVAFASKETLSNVFGAGILVADRPFRRGDWIEAGDAKGAVEQVGIRSTRIRTGDDSLMFVPNGKLADATVNNLGTRRHRVTKAKLLVAHGTPPDVLESFMESLAALAAGARQVQPGSVQVGLGALGSDGVEVDMSCCLDVRSAADERSARTALMLDVLRLADGMRVRLGDAASAKPLLAPA